MNRVELISEDIMSNMLNRTKVLKGKVYDVSDEHKYKLDTFYPINSHPDVASIECCKLVESDDKEYVEYIILNLLKHNLDLDTHISVDIREKFKLI